MYTNFYLARHGETEWNTVKRLQGQLNSPLTSQGLEQANQLALKLSEQSITHIISSPLQRAYQTAKICSNLLNLELETDDALMERHFGHWQGKLFDELNNQPYFEKIFFEVTEHRPPDGESAIELQERLTIALKGLANKYQNGSILIVSHGDLIRCFLAKLRNKNFCDAYSQYGNGSYFSLKYDHKMDKFKLDLDV
ncbi:histidine phosphatase family protein [Pleionea sediminis]|uniref:histidine phosphatase family protein n=1 Tax=Pleionea sediminis TaxID=2569479 RepID=UPI00118478BE|nr:histidine phosphatase family protein [Pleionea sediminis]